MQGLASGTGYLDLESTEIPGRAARRNRRGGRCPRLTIYKLSLTGLQDPELTGLTAEPVATIRAADTVIQESGFSGKTTWVSVDADGYIREVRTTYTFRTGSNVRPGAPSSRTSAVPALSSCPARRGRRLRRPGA